MTCDERLEALLNRAGQTISDLPKPSDYCFAHDVNNPEIKNLVEATVREFCELDDDCGTGIRAYHDYILHLTDVIDRMETALVNVIGERDWLRFLHCEICDMEPNGASCEYCNVKIGGVPEDRMVDDDEL